MKNIGSDIRVRSVGLGSNYRTFSFGCGRLSLYQIMIVWGHYLEDIREINSFDEIRMCPYSRLRSDILYERY